MLGSAFAGTEEAPGEIVQKSVVLPESQKTVKVPFKVLRGMASLEAIRDRLDVEDADRVELEALGAEGMEVSVPARGSARTDRPRHDQASVLVDQLRRRLQPRRTAVDVLGRPGQIPDQAVVFVASGSLTTGRFKVRDRVPNAERRTPEGSPPQSLHTVGASFSILKSIRPRSGLSSIRGSRSGLTFQIVRPQTVFRCQAQPAEWQCPAAERSALLSTGQPPREQLFVGIG